MDADLGPTFAALADPARRGAVELLLERPRRSSELAEALDLTRPAMSRHLRVLRDAGLVRQEPVEGDARVRMVHLRPERFAELRGWLDQVEAFWRAQLGAFKAHAERPRGRRGR